MTEKNGAENKVGEVEDVTVVRRAADISLSVIEKAEIESAIVTAKQYPRSISKFNNDLLSLACQDPVIAKECFYVVPRAGGTIEGPSIRLAELAAIAWTNIAHDGEVLGDDGRYISARGVCRDLERNVLSRETVKRRIVDKNGRRFSEDMIQMTGNAALSIAKRNAILRIVPRSLIRPAFEKCKEIAVGKAESLSAKRKEVLAALYKMGVLKERLLAVLKRRSIEDIDKDDLITLIGMTGALKSGEIELDTAFPPVEVEAEGSLDAEPASEKKGKGKKGAGKPPKPSAEARAALAKAKTAIDKVKAEAASEKKTAGGKDGKKSNLFGK